MGASLLIREHPWAERAAVQKWARECASEDAYENGNSYSGGWNMKHGAVIFDEQKVFDSTQAAHEYIGNENDKHGSLLAVPAISRKSLNHAQTMADAKYKELWDAIQTLQRECLSQNATIVTRVRESKSAFKACTGCGSKISTKHLRSVTCPVCNANLLRTPTDDKKLEALKKREQAQSIKLKQRYEVLLKRAFPPGELQKKVWVVGGWCAC